MKKQVDEGYEGSESKFIYAFKTISRAQSEYDAAFHRKVMYTAGIQLDTAKPVLTKHSLGEC